MICGCACNHTETGELPQRIWLPWPLDLGVPMFLVGGFASPVVKPAVHSSAPVSSSALRCRDCGLQIQPDSASIFYSDPLPLLPYILLCKNLHFSMPVNGVL